MPLAAVKVHFPVGGNISVKSKPKEFVISKFSRFAAACAAVVSFQAFAPGKSAVLCSSLSERSK